MSEIENGQFYDGEDLEISSSMEISFDTLKPLPATTNGDLICALLTIKNFFNIDAQQVYIPCSGYDYSPAVVFGTERCIFVDNDIKVVEALKNQKINAHQMDAYYFNPGSIDLMILLNPQIKLPLAALYSMVEGGYVICNNYHGSATEMIDEPYFELIGVLDNNSKTVNNGNYLIETDNLDEYFLQVYNDELWRQKGNCWRAQTYDRAVELFDLLEKPKTDNLTEAYSQFVFELVAEDFFEHFPEEEFDPEYMVEQLFIQDKSGQMHFVEQKLPYIRGRADDLFVFKKTSEYNPR